MEDAERTEAAPTDEIGPGSELDTGHPPWVRIVTLLVLALFLLVTVVAALA